MLSLKDNQVADLTPLEPLTDLQFLFLDKNPVADITPLHRMWKKDNDGAREWAPYCQIFLTGCPLNEASRKLAAELKTAGARLTL
jgi:Leucine-rich repeat (LRR) protein